jgi:hypothetical protein
VLERRREIGVLRAMGTSRRFILRMILAESDGTRVHRGRAGDQPARIAAASAPRLNIIEAVGVD